MSGVNITILEGGKSENFGQVTKLRTSNGADHDLWVPKTDVETKHLSVKKNGLYYTNQYQPTSSEKKSGKAYDIYGWDTITVSVKKKVTGKKKKRSPSTGIEYDAPTSVDIDDDGNIIETELPVYIEIEQPPDKLEYRDGESISKAGMVVKAYYADDREWGTVPNSDTTLKPSVAEGGGGGMDIYNVSQAGEHLITFRASNFPWHRNYRKAFDGEAYFAFIHTEGWYIPLVISTEREACLVQYQERDDGTWKSAQGGTIFRYNDNIYYYSDGGGQSGDSIISSDKPLYGDFLTLDLALQTIAAIIDSGGGSGAQTITVGWTPPEGEEELTDTFDITVIPSN